MNSRCLYVGQRLLANSCHLPDTLDSVLLTVCCLLRDRSSIALVCTQWRTAVIALRNCNDRFTIYPYTVRIRYRFTSTSVLYYLWSEEGVQAYGGSYSFVTSSGSMRFPCMRFPCNEIAGFEKQILAPTQYDVLRDAKFSRRIIFAVFADWSPTAKIKLANFLQ